MGRDVVRINVCWNRWRIRARVLKRSADTGVQLKRLSDTFLFFQWLSVGRTE